MGGRARWADAESLALLIGDVNEHGDKQTTKERKKDITEEEDLDAHDLANCQKKRRFRARQSMPLETGE